MGDAAQNLPTLQDKRLTYMSKVTRRSRKLTQISNDTLARNTSVYTKCVNREKQSYDFRSWQRSKPFRDSLIQARSTQKCLKKHKLCDCFVNSPKFNYGMYGGIQLRNLRHEIEETIKQAHPRMRRLREVKKLLDDGRKDGRLVNYDKVKKTLDEILNRSYQTSVFGLTWSPTGYDFDDGNSRIRLPPISVSRENTKEFLRPKSKSVMERRYKTFTLEPSTSRF
jgi:hypothetical protein